MLIALSVFVSSCGIFKHSNKSVSSNTNKLSNNKINEVIKTALTYKGVPYKLGGYDKKGIDCSGLVKLSFEKINIVLPRRSIEQSNTGKEVELDKAQRGDLIFFRFDKNAKNNIDHVGIISDVSDKKAIKFIHASTKLGVTEDNLSKPYNQKCFVKCMRVYE